MHPRLFTSMILLDPVLQKIPMGPDDWAGSPARLSTHRKDLWPSRHVAAERQKNSKSYQSWDPRVLERLKEFGLRDLPTAIHPEVSANTGEKPVTLTTTKHQEVFTFVRPNYEGSGHQGRPVNRQTQPDFDPMIPATYPFYRPEISQVFFRLPEVRPSVLYVFGDLSYMSTPDLRKEKLEATGIGVGGSGGAKDGRVKGVVLKNVGHLVAMEAAGHCADAASEWLGQELHRWRVEEEQHEKFWGTKSPLEKATINDEWKKRIGGPARHEKSVLKTKI